MNEKLINGDEEEMMEQIMTDGKELGKPFRVKKLKKKHVVPGPRIKVKGISLEQNERQKEYMTAFDGTGMWLFKNYEKMCCRSVAGRAKFKEEMAEEKDKRKKTGKLRRGK